MSQWERSELVLGHEALARLRAARVAVFGVGGVGGYAVEALARAGVGSLALFDPDTVSESNINRQILALHSTLGKYKVDVAAARVRDIDPSIKVSANRMFYLPQNADEVDLSQFDFVIDAIDTVAAKLELARRAAALGVPLIASMGTGNKLDPSRFRITDISKTAVCPLARTMRTLCRKHGIKKLRVLWSDEEPTGATLPDENGRHVPGSISFVPAVAGLMIAGEVIRTLAKSEGEQ